MLKNKYLIRIVKGLSLVIPLLLIVSFCQMFLFAQNDNNTWRIKGFYLEEDNSLDVVLLGASDVFTGYSAGLAFDEFGYTSYSYASDAASVILWKYQIEEIKKHHNPSIILIEVNGVLQGEDDLVYNDARYRQYMDNVPLSLHKIDSILNSELKDDKFSYLIPFVKYHSNLKDVKDIYENNMYYLEQGYSKLKGFSSLTSIEKSNKPIPVEKDKCLPLKSESKKYLLDFLDYCKKNKINNIVFTRFPHKITTEMNAERVYRCNTVKKIVSQQGFSFIDLEEKANTMGIDINFDYYDDDHLNCLGARKLTSYLGNLLVQDYNVAKTNLSITAKAKWDNSAEYTKKIFQYAEECISQGKKEIISEKPK